MLLGWIAQPLSIDFGLGSLLRVSIMPAAFHVKNGKPLPTMGCIAQEICHRQNFRIRAARDSQCSSKVWSQLRRDAGAAKLGTHDVTLCLVSQKFTGAWLAIVVFGAKIAPYSSLRRSGIALAASCAHGTPGPLKGCQKFRLMFRRMIKKGTQE